MKITVFRVRKNPAILVNPSPDLADAEADVDLSPSKAGELLGVSTATVRELGDSGALKIKRNPSGRPVIATGELQRFAKRGTEPIELSDGADDEDAGDELDEDAANADSEPVIVTTLGALRAAFGQAFGLDEKPAKPANVGRAAKATKPAQAADEDEADKASSPWFRFR